MPVTTKYPSNAATSTRRISKPFSVAPVRPGSLGSAGVGRSALSVTSFGSINVLISVVSYLCVLNVCSLLTPADCRPLLVTRMEQAEHCRNKEESRGRCTQQAADNCTPERSVLLSAFTQADRHRNHADDHGESGHNHWPESGGASFKSRFERTAV